MRHEGRQGRKRDRFSEEGAVGCAHPRLPKHVFGGRAHSRPGASDQGLDLIEGPREETTDGRHEMGG